MNKRHGCPLAIRNKPQQASKKANKQAHAYSLVWQMSSQRPLSRTLSRDPVAKSFISQWFWHSFLWFVGHPGHLILWIPVKQFQHTTTKPVLGILLRFLAGILLPIQAYNDSCAKLRASGTTSQAGDSTAVPKVSMERVVHLAPKTPRTLPLDIHFWALPPLNDSL